MPPPPNATNFSPRVSPGSGLGLRPHHHSRRMRTDSFGAHQSLREIGSPSSSPFVRNMDDRRSISLNNVLHNLSPPQSPKPVPFLPNMQSSLPPTHDPAVDHAVEAERARIREREKEEKDMDADQLKQALKRERAHSCRLASELAALKSANVKSQAEAEAYEEGRINSLMRRLECLQREKGRIIVELEREEEMLTNSLQKKLNEVRREKALLEQQIEREHSANTDLRSRLGSSRQQTQTNSYAQTSQESSSENGNA